MKQLLQRKRMVFMWRQRIKDLLLRNSVVITTANWKFPRRSLFARLWQTNEQLQLFFLFLPILSLLFVIRRFLNSLLSAEGSRQAALSLIVLVLCDSLEKSRPYVELFCCSILTGYVHLLQTSVWGVPVPRGPSVGKPTAANQSAGLFAGPPQEDPFDAMNKKKRKKKMQKVDPSILGFSVNAADRVNMGEIQTVEDWERTTFKKHCGAIEPRAKNLSEKNRFIL